MSPSRTAPSRTRRSSTKIRWMVARHLSVGALWEYYTQYPYLTRMRNRSVLDRAIADVLGSFTWEAEGFALADAFGSDGRYAGLSLPGAGAAFGTITDATLLVRPDVAAAQVPEAVCVTVTDAGPGSSVQDGGTLTPDGPDQAGIQGPVDPVRNTRFFGVYAVDPERYSRDLTRLSQEVLQHLAALDGVDLGITVEIHARRPEGFPDDKARVILENAKTLKFDQSGFDAG